MPGINKLEKMNFGEFFRQLHLFFRDEAVNALSFSEFQNGIILTKEFSIFSTDPFLNEDISFLNTENNVKFDYVQLVKVENGENDSMKIILEKSIEGYTKFSPTTLHSLFLAITNMSNLHLIHLLIKDKNNLFEIDLDNAIFDFNNNSITFTKGKK